MNKDVGYFKGGLIMGVITMTYGQYFNCLAIVCIITMVITTAVTSKWYSGLKERCNKD